MRSLAREGVRVAVAVAAFAGAIFEALISLFLYRIASLYCVLSWSTCSSESFERSPESVRSPARVSAPICDSLLNQMLALLHCSFCSGPPAAPPACRARSAGKAACVPGDTSATALSLPSSRDGKSVDDGGDVRRVSRTGVPKTIDSCSCSDPAPPRWSNTPALQRFSGEAFFALLSVSADSSIASPSTLSALLLEVSHAPHFRGFFAFKKVHLGHDQPLASPSSGSEMSVWRWSRRKPLSLSSMPTVQDFAPALRPAFFLMAFLKHAFLTAFLEHACGLRSWAALFASSLPCCIAPSTSSSIAGLLPSSASTTAPNPPVCFFATTAFLLPYSSRS